MFSGTVAACQCPKCRKKFFLPGGRNMNFVMQKVIRDLLTVYYGEEREIYARFLAEKEKSSLKEDLRAQVYSELKTEMEGTILDGILQNKADLVAEAGEEAADNQVELDRQHPTKWIAYVPKVEWVIGTMFCLYTSVLIYQQIYPHPSLVKIVNLD
jgi:hypothetical protein